MNDAHASEWGDLLPAYALGALEGEELRRLEDHLAAGCPACEEELRRLTGDLEALAMAPPLPGAPEAAEALEILGAVRERLLRELPARPAPAPRAAKPSAPPSRRVLEWREARPSRRAWLAWAALVVLVLGGALWRSRLDSEIERLQGERARLAVRAGVLERQAAALEAESGRLERTLAIIAAPGVHAVELAGMGKLHAATGRTWVDAADRRAVFYGYHLPVLPPDKTYQLWFVDDEDRNISAGVFAADAHGVATYIVDQQLPVERIQSWVVTVEPRGGRPQPTGPIALAG